MQKTLLAAALTLTAGCLSRGADFVPFLRPTATATLSELVDRINEWADVHSLVMRVDLQFETVEEVEEGRGRRFRPARGRLLLERPSHIRLNIEAPILGANIAEMASDGEHFALLIHPAEYRALILGSNRERYLEEMAKLEEDPELSKAGPLLNIRPQHFTDAFLPFAVDDETIAFLHEEQVVEPDLRRGADDDAQVRKSYHVVTVVRRGEHTPYAQFWFDRIPEITLARQRVFDEEGLLRTDIRYADFLPPDAETGKRFPRHVRIERPYEDYALVVTVDPGGLQVNRELPQTAFEVTVPEEWEGSVRRIDLDERAGAP